MQVVRPARLAEDRIHSEELRRRLVVTAIYQGSLAGGHDRPSAEMSNLVFDGKQQIV